MLDTPKKKKKENWNRLRQSGVYEVDFFGDMVIHAIARGCNKNILIFNTSVEAADPIYVIEASQFGGFSDTDIPVVVAYNQVHYESLHPLTEDDIENTKMLVNSYIDGTYQFTKKDIPYLISTSAEGKSASDFVNVSYKDQYDTMFPPIMKKQRKRFDKKKCFKQNTLPRECSLSDQSEAELDKLKQKDKTERTKAKIDQIKIPTEASISNNSTESKEIVLTHAEEIIDHITIPRTDKSKKLRKRRSSVYLGIQNIGVNKKRKVLNVREMSEEKKRNYWRELKSSQRDKKRQQNEEQLKKKMTSEKSAQRVKIN